MKKTFLTSVVRNALARAGAFLAISIVFGVCLSAAISADNQPDPIRQEETPAKGVKAEDEGAVDVACVISSITVANISLCNNNGTNNIGEDDTFTADVTVTYSGKPQFGSLKLLGRGNASASVNQIDVSSHIFTDVVMNTGADGVGPDLEQIYLSAYFSADPTCLFTNTNAGLAPDHCSTGVQHECTFPDGTYNAAYPVCWPSENPAIIALDECENSLNYAPDASSPEETPIKYVRVVLHVMQREDPNNLGNHVPHPTDPENWSLNEIDIIKTWFDFTTQGNVNSFLGNLCADPTDGSPDMTDSRIRLLNLGIPDYDVFFHPDDRGWGEYFSSPPQPANSGTNLNCLITQYLTGQTNPTCNPSTWHGGLTQNYITTIQSDEIRNAYHVFITRGNWHDDNGNGIVDLPSEMDYGVGGGYTTNASLGCDANGNSPSQISGLFTGSYQAYLNNNAQGHTTGRGFVGELYHILGVDHTSPMQNHRRHFNYVDGCEDTVWESDLNVLGCNFNGNRCAITQCQLGKMHYLIENNNAAFVRFPDGNGGFTLDGNCAIASPDIVIENGENITWNWHRQIRSNVIIQPGGKLTIRCDIGFPENAKITVNPTGQLIIDGARLYNNCDGDYWDGIVVEGAGSGTQDYDIFNQTYYQGYLQINTGSVVERAKVGVACQSATGNAKTGGIVRATGATFLNCQVRAVHIRDFQNVGISTGQPKVSQCRFFNCNFIVDDDYTGSFTGNFQDMVRLRNVDGVQFAGGYGFTNVVPAGQTPTQNDRKYGIFATNAGFSVTGKCNGTSLPCTSYTNATFTGFDRGILTGSHSAFRVVSVSNTDFTDNVVGIEGTNIKNAYIVSNNFNVGCNLPFTVPQVGSIKANRGLMLYGCTGYKVENNTSIEFNGAGTTNPVGILITSSGQQPNEVYRNNQSLLDIGNLSNGRNRNISPLVIQGLQYLCNTNSSNTFFDFAIPKEVGSVGYGIRGSQGSASLGAGNTFSAANASSDPELHVQNSQNFITYFCNGGALCPTNFNLLKVNLAFGASNQCPSKLPSGKEQGGLSQPEKEQFQQDFGSLTGTIESRTYAADMLVRNYLIDSTYTDFTEVKNILTQKGDLESRFGVVDVLIDEGNATAAQQSLSAIPNEFTLTGESLTAYNHFNTLKSLQINALQNGLSDEVLVANNLTTLTQLAGAGDYLASVQAQVLLNGVNGFTYTPEVILPSPNPQDRGSMPQAIVDQDTASPLIEAQPNPAQQQTIFSYRLPKEVEQSQIIVTDLDGRTIAVLDIKGGSGSMAWDIAGIKQGIYLYSLVANGRVLATRQLLITR